MIANVVPDAWWFVAAAYAVAVGGTLGLVGWTVVALRRAERRAAAIGR